MAASPALSKRRGAPHLSEVTPDAKKGKQTKAMLVAGVKKKSGKYTQFCPGCLLWFLPQDIAQGQKLDHKCKGIMDRIYYIAIAQGGMEWYATVRSNDQKMLQVITKFKEKCPEINECSPVRVKAGTMWHHLELIVFKTVIIRDVVGEFMYEREYYAFAETWKGGRLTEEQSKLQWLKWKREAQDPDILFPPTDQEGPEHAPFRVWVKTATKMHFQEAEERQKQLVMAEKSKKDMTAAEIESARKRLMTNHATIGGASPLKALAETAALLASSGHGGGASLGALQGRIADVGDVLALVPDTDEEDGQEVAEDEEDAEDACDVEEGAEPHGKKLRKPPVWFDWDRAVSAFVRGEETQVKALKETTLKTLASMKALLEQVASERYKHLLPFLGGDHTVMRKRYNFLMLTVSDKPTAEDDLKAAIAIVKEEADKASAGSEAGDKGGGRSKGSRGPAFGMGPPSPNYHLTLSFTELEGMKKKYYDCTTRQDMIAMQKRHRLTRKANGELTGNCALTCRGFKQAFEKVIKGYGAPTEKGGKGGRGKGSRGAGASDVTPVVVATRIGMDLFDFAPPAKDSVLIAVLPDATKDTFDKHVVAQPAIVQVEPETVHKFKEDPLKSLPSTFFADYAQSAERTTKGRGARRITAGTDAHMLVKDLMLEAMPADHFETKACVEKIADPAWFALTRDYITPFMGIEGLACLRLTLSGTRALVMARLSDMLSFMGKQGIADEFRNPARAWSYMKAMSKELIDKFAESASFYCATVGEHEMLYTPAGFITVEKTSGSDVSGVAMRLLVMSDASAVSAFETLRVYAKDKTMADAVIKYYKALKAPEAVCPPK